MNGLAKKQPDINCLSNELETIIRSPIILTGRGGSGTRMLSHLASTGDVFIGNELNTSGDSVEWAELLYAMSIQKLALSDVEFESKKQGWENELLLQAKEYLEKGNWRPSQLWGWKLPESMFVIPELTNLFTSAKVIHLVRHPVSSSIRRTHKTSRKNNPIGKAVLKAAYDSSGRNPTKIDTDEDYLRNALTWRYQVEAVRHYAERNLPKNRYWEVRYEDICAHPVDVRSKLLKFLNLSSKEEVNVENTVQIDNSRNNASSFSDPRASEVWDLCSKTAIALGYNDSGVNHELD